ncbi:ImpA-related N-terminal family protein [Escherichia coli]|nr:ImpA-related N-terminal family protein [Escherichia coli]
MTSEVKLKTGGDPRSFPDYAALRDEISKLTHPARPDVDWRYVETLCLRLYEHNGVELQTASWYTIARMHTTGLSGLNEGLALIVALTRHHWSVMWPLNTHARLEIITGLFNRLQKTLRAMPPDDRDNLPLLYQTETFLKALSDTLAWHELKQSSKVALPEAMVKGYITRLENQPVQGEASSPVTLPAQALRSDAPDVQEHQTLPHSRLVYVVSETKTESTPSLQKSPPTFLKPFVAGVCAALLTVSVAILGWQFLTQPSPAEQQLRALLRRQAELDGMPAINAKRWSSLICFMAAASSEAGTTCSPAATAVRLPSWYCLRQRNNWLAATPCCRATRETVIPGSKLC